MLTKKQRDLLKFLHDRIKETGISPSFEEMKEALGLRSKSGIHRLIIALEERGFLKRMANRARAIEIIKLPHYSRSDFRENGSFRPGVVAGSKASENTSDEEDKEKTTIIPVMGTIAAGVPISAIQDHINDIIVPLNLLKRGDSFALEIKGDSMINAGIFDGDTVIIQRCSNADNGDIIVALIDNEEATLKRLRKRGNSIALEAANPAYETRIFGPDRVSIQGRVTGLIRQY